jgi:competence protein ComEA
MKKLYDKYNIYLCGVLLFITISLIFYILYYKKEKIIYKECNNNVIEESKLEEYYVDIKGEVNNPGVYKVDSNLRINDVINIAGGLTKNANLSLLNLSKKIFDEMNIKIYSNKEVQNALKNIKEPTVIEVIKEIEKECNCPDINDACIKVESEENSSLININTATKEELMTITGIGESKANNIIEYRKTTAFNLIDDIKNVNGIGDSIFENIKNYITV